MIAIDLSLHRSASSTSPLPLPRHYSHRRSSIGMHRLHSSIYVVITGRCAATARAMFHASDITEAGRLLIDAATSDSPQVIKEAIKTFAHLKVSLWSIHMCCHLGFPTCGASCTFAIELTGYLLEILFFWSWPRKAVLSCLLAKSKINMIQVKVFISSSKMQGFKHLFKITLRWTPFFGLRCLKG